MIAGAQAGDAALTAFLASAGCSGWEAIPLAGDASARRYWRLAGPEGRSRILMAAPPAEREAFAAFCRMSDHLRALGLAAPEVIRAEPAAGLALLEDLGPDRVAEHLDAVPSDAGEVLSAAVDVLLRLDRTAPPPGLPSLTPLRGAGMISPVWEWYAPHRDARATGEVAGALQALLARHAPLADRLALRDFHAENLIWRPHREGAERIGLLDFQDAMAAPQGYDLASLLRDARRGLDRDLSHDLLRRFARGAGREPEDLAASVRVLAVQRNLRILGIFARLARRDGKRRYLRFLPRLWALLQEDLAEPPLAPLARLLAPLLPAPEAAIAAWPPS